MIIDMSRELYCILFFVISVIGYIFYKKRNATIQYWIIPVFVIYLLYLLKVTLFPIFIFDQETLEKVKEGVENYMVFYQLKPFASIVNYFREGAMIQLIGNVILLSPLVVFGEIVTRGKWRITRMILLVSSVSLLIELLQLVINYSTGYPYRVADVDDLILNVTGVIITMLVLRAAEKVVSRKEESCLKIRALLYKE